MEMCTAIPSHFSVLPRDVLSNRNKDRAEGGDENSAEEPAYQQQGPCSSLEDPTQKENVSSHSNHQTGPISQQLSTIY